MKEEDINIEINRLAHWALDSLWLTALAELDISEHDAELVLGALLDRLGMR